MRLFLYPCNQLSKAAVQGGDWKLEIGGNWKLEIGGNWKLEIGGNWKLY
jgi:hypothetical protein